MDADKGNSTTANGSAFVPRSRNYGGQATNGREYKTKPASTRVRAIARNATLSDRCPSSSVRG